MLKRFSVGLQPRVGVPQPWRRLSALRPVAQRSHSPSWSPGRGERDAALARVEAALFAAEEPLPPRRLAVLANLPDAGEARRQVERLNRVYRDDNNAFHVEELAGGYQLLTQPSLRPWLDKLLHLHPDLQLSNPTLETLAIVAYRQPIFRADVEAIRGVQVGELLHQLLDKGLIRLLGKDESLGRPYLYGTTKKFLQVFGLRNLHELPLVEVLAKPADAASAGT